MIPNGTSLSVGVSGTLLVMAIVFVSSQANEPGKPENPEEGAEQAEDLESSRTFRFASRDGYDTTLTLTLPRRSGPGSMNLRVRYYNSGDRPVSFLHVGGKCVNHSARLFIVQEDSGLIEIPENNLFWATEGWDRNTPGIRNAAGSSYRRKVDPGKSIEWEYDLSKIYSMPDEGEYALDFFMRIDSQSEEFKKSGDLIFNTLVQRIWVEKLDFKIESAN